MKNKIFYLIRDHFPVFRPDLVVLFGDKLRKIGFESDLLGQLAASAKSEDVSSWSAGEVHILGKQSHAGWYEVVRPLFDALLFLKIRRTHRIIQVRDKIRAGFFALLLARILGKKFTFWMSFPFAEGFVVRRQQMQGNEGFAARVLIRLRAKLAGAIFYKFVASRADHVFVQSEAMLDFMTLRGIRKDRMTAVPMGVDLPFFSAVRPAPTISTPMAGRKVIAYLGSMGRARQTGFMLDVLREVRKTEPNAMLLLAGTGASPDEIAWVKEKIESSGISDYVWWTGWLPQLGALELLAAADVGLSPIPRGQLFDVSSPTKAVEYLALGLPCVGNDIPDQALVLNRSGGGICVPMDVQAFSQACLRLLADADLRREMGAKGKAWVAENRSYEVLAESVAAEYRRLLAPAS